MINSNFLFAGRASYVVRNPSNESVTVMVTKARPKVDIRTGKPWAPVYFVSMRHNNDARQYVGTLAPGGDTVRVNPNARFGNIDKPVAVINWSLKMVLNQRTLPAGYSIEHTGRCGKCAKMLRDPESVALGIGPVCRG